MIRTMRSFIAGVYPRVGGATASRRRTRLFRCGLSPRGRGNRRRQGRPDAHSRSIPAWAGQPVGSPSSALEKSVYPRVGGATCSASWKMSAWTGLSPRGRGNPLILGEPVHRMRSIPAWAGQPITISSSICLPLVYPRVGGATRSSQTPRRGSPRSIPAWAGQPR